MNCTEARHHWNLYHDSEGDAELHFRISEHLAICPHCAQWFSQQSRLESLIVDKLRFQTPTPEMWNRVLGNCGFTKPMTTRHWLWLSGIAAGVVLTVAMYSTFFVRGFTSPPDLAKLSAKWHERLQTGEETPHLRSQSDLEVEGYLRQRVTFPVRCPPRKDAGFAVAGAGVCRLADQPTAYLSGHVNTAPVSIFVLPRDSLDSFPRQRNALNQRISQREGPYQVVMGVIDRNAVLVIGQTEPENLERVLLAYGTYPDHH